MTTIEKAENTTMTANLALDDTNMAAVSARIDKLKNRTERQDVRETFNKTQDCLARAAALRAGKRPPFSHDDETPEESDDRAARFWSETLEWLDKFERQQSAK